MGADEKEVSEMQANDDALTLSATDAVEARQTNTDNSQPTNDTLLIPVSAEELADIIDPASKFETPEEAVEYADKRLWKALPQAIDTLQHVMDNGTERMRVEVAKHVIDRVMGPSHKTDRVADTPLDKMLAQLVKTQTN
jgi:hypothetical protein